MTSPSKRRLRLPFVRRPDPELTTDETQFLAALLNQHIDWAARKMSEGLVSESVIRNRMHAESALAKVQEALRR